MPGQESACGILLLGTGVFTEVMLIDTSASPRTPLRVIVGGCDEARMRALAG